MGSPGRGSEGDPQRGQVTIMGSRGAQINLTGPVTYGRFGAACAVIDMNLDGFLDLAVGAPQVGGKDLEHVVGSYEGNVYIFLGSSTGVSLTPNCTIFGTAPFGQLGSVLATLSIGLAIGAPTATGAAGPQAGALAVFIPGFRFTANSTFLMDAANILLWGPRAFSWFGSAVAIAGNTVFVGVPGFRTEAGTVGAVVLYNYFAGPPQLNVQGTIEGSEQRAAFGSAIAAGASSVAFSAPFHGHRIVSLKDHVSQGEVFVAPLSVASSISGNHSIDTVSWSAHIYGNNDFACLGSTMAVANISGHDVFVFASPRGEEEMGSVSVWDGVERALIDGDARRERFGAALTIADLNGDGKMELAVSAPRRDGADGTASLGGVTIVPLV